MDDLIARLVSEGALEEAPAEKVREAIAGGRSIDDAIATIAGVSEDKVLRFLGEYYHIPFVDLEKDAAKYAPQKELLSKFPAGILLARRVMPLGMNGDAHGDGVAIVTSKVFDTTALDELRLSTGLDVHPVLAPSSEIARFMKKYLGVGARHAAIDGARQRR